MVFTGGTGAGTGAGGGGGGGGAGAFDGLGTLAGEGWYMRSSGRSNSFLASDTEGALYCSSGISASDTSTGVGGGGLAMTGGGGALSWGRVLGLMIARQFIAVKLRWEVAASSCKLGQHATFISLQRLLISQLTMPNTSEGFQAV